MREIKFRGWYTGPYENRMLEPNFNGPVNEIFNDPDNEGKVIYMQYTGIKDMYGQEVYEGDILETKQRHTNKLIITKVEFVQGAFVETVVRDESERINRSFIPLDADCSKIIGNIYENPELLGDSQ